MKESKSINNANLAKLRSFASKNPNDRVTSFVLDSMTRFMSADSRAKYHAPYFVTEQECQTSIKNADYASLDKCAIEDIMERITPECDGKGGDILKLIEQESNVQKYFEFFPFVKTLSKMCCLAIITRKEQHLRNLVETADF